MSKSSTQAAYPSPFEDGNVNLLSIKELNALSLSATIREKPNWVDKIHDEPIVAKWRAEVPDLSDDVFTFALDDAKWRKETRRVAMRDDEEVIVEDATVHGVVQGIRIIPRETDEKIKAALNRITSSADYRVDYHPWANDQIINYLHPSLYSYVSRKTPQRSPENVYDWDSFSAWALSGVPEDSPKGDEDGIKENRERKPRHYHNSGREDFISERFQWLPTEVLVSDEGNSVRFTSYVNNLHPIKDRDLIEGLESVVSAMVPLFEQCLGHLDHPWKANDPYVACETTYEDRDEEDVLKRGGQLIRSMDEGNGEVYKTYMFPEGDLTFERPGTSKGADGEGPSLGHPHASYFPSLANSKLQVILKVAETAIAPGKSYSGGSWHVEGMENEAIVCTGIYYQQVENLSESRLRFRTKVEEYYGYEQNDNDGFERTYGVPSDEDGDYQLCQELGFIKAKAGLCIAFPNTYQHRVDPFHLLDPTKPGLRRTVVCFLVDPIRPRQLTTAFVAPQQPPVVLDAFQSVSKDGLDADVALMCVMNLGGVYDRARAEEYRLDLMKERKFLQDKASSELYERSFSLCEH